MTTKEEVLALLTERQGQYISGKELGEQLHVTRSAIWKAIKALREQGHHIDAVTNLGYRLPARTDELDAVSIRHYIETADQDYLYHKPSHSLVVPLHSYPVIHVQSVVDSTNDWAIQWNGQHMESHSEHVFIANEQTNGRGRRGRSFHSSPNTGIYMSFLLHPNIAGDLALKMTALASVAVAQAIEEVTGISLQIKWVNDLYYKDRKVAGILTEGNVSLEDLLLHNVVVGIGINLYPPADGFPKELQNTAGSIFPAGNIPPNLRNRLIASIIRHVYAFRTHIDPSLYLEEYRRRSYLKDKWVCIHPTASTARGGYAQVMDIDDELHLIVKNESGKTEILSTGEVSVVKY